MLNVDAILEDAGGFFLGCHAMTSTHCRTGDDESVTWTNGALSANTTE